jgi:pyruvate/2-oxoglutarate dehydrogenase complex dihydrolipoamide acyltransferase (E2) component
LDDWQQPALPDALSHLPGLALAMPQVPLKLADLDLGKVPVLACSWLVDHGSNVVQGDRLLEVLAGEVTVDLPAPASGRLVQRCVGPEDRLEIGQLLAVIQTTEPVLSAR